MSNKLFPEIGFLRLPQILGDIDNPPIIPISKSSWWAGVRSGRYPKPIKLSERCTAWRVEDIRDLILDLAVKEKGAHDTS